mmetsp:Transcript_42006/g.100978  ORF Transcript_42006/g.100978 Transcript_42006/m.100978 type:complete len:368 (+) Transcript_42006:2-1105(+)
MVHSQNPFTNAVRPFHNCLPISSGYLHDELLEHDYAFRHATMSCGQCWQSIVSQHVRMPTLWWWTKSASSDSDFDQQPGKQLEQQQQEYGRPPLGSPEPFDCPWMYVVNNTIRGHPLLIRQVPNVRSPGVILLHLVVRSYKTVESYRGHHHHQNSVFCELEDVVVGCYHPTHHRTTSPIKSATGGSHNNYDVDENIRHVWISHRSRSAAGNKTAAGSKKSSLLYTYLQQQQTTVDRNSLYTNPFMVHTSSSSNHHDPKHHRMNTNQQSGHRSNYNNNSHDKAVNNDNLRYVFGDRPPLSTIMVTEPELLQLVEESQRRHIPVSIMLLQKYLWTPKVNTKAAKTASSLSSSTTTDGSSSTKTFRTGWW